MDTDFFARVTAAVAAPGSRSERARAAAELIRNSTAERWVGMYTVTDTTVVNEAWSGPAPPAFPSFPWALQDTRAQRDRRRMGHEAIGVMEKAESNRAACSTGR